MKRNIESIKHPRMYTENWWNEKENQNSVRCDSITWIPSYFICIGGCLCVLNKYEIIWWEKKKLVRQFVTRVGSIGSNKCALLLFFFSLYLTISSFPSESLRLNFYWINKQSQCCNWQFDCFSFPHSENIFGFFQLRNLFTVFSVATATAGGDGGGSGDNLIETIIRQQSDNAPLTVDSINVCDENQRLGWFQFIHILCIHIKTRSKLMCSMNREIWFFRRCSFFPFSFYQNFTFFHSSFFPRTIVQFDRFFGRTGQLAERNNKKKGETLNKICNQSLKWFYRYGIINAYGCYFNRSIGKIGKISRENPQTILK